MDTEQDQKIQLPVYLSPKYAVVNACLEAGLQQSVIAKGVGKTDGSISRLKQNIKNKYDLTNNKRVKAAVTVHDLMMQAILEPDKMDRPLPFALKASDVNTNIDRVMDRYQPKVTKMESQNLNVNLQVDYSEFLQGCK